MAGNGEHYNFFPLPFESLIVFDCFCDLTDGEEGEGRGNMYKARYLMNEQRRGMHFIASLVSIDLEKGYIGAEKCAHSHQKMENIERERVFKPRN